MKLRIALFLAVFILLASSTSALVDINPIGILKSPAGNIGVVVLLLAGIWWVASYFGGSGGGGAPDWLTKGGQWAAQKLGERFKATEEAASVELAAVTQDENAVEHAQADEENVELQEYKSEQQTLETEAEIDVLIQKLIDYLKQIINRVESKTIGSEEQFINLIKATRNVLNSVIAKVEQVDQSLVSTSDKMTKENNLDKMQERYAQSEEDIDNKLRKLLLIRDWNGFYTKYPEKAAEVESERQGIAVEINKINTEIADEIGKIKESENQRLRQEKTQERELELKQAKEINGVRRISDTLLPLQKGSFKDQTDIVDRLKQAIERLGVLGEAVKEDEQEVTGLEQRLKDRAKLKRFIRAKQGEKRRTYASAAARLHVLLTAVRAKALFQKKN